MRSTGAASRAADASPAQLRPWHSLVRRARDRHAAGNALGGGAEGGIGDLDAVLDKARHGAAAAELAVVGVRRQDEHIVEAFDAHVRYSPR